MNMLPKNYYQSIEDRQILMCVALKHQMKELDKAIAQLEKTNPKKV